MVICLVITQNPMLMLLSAFIGIGLACTYAIMFPLTFKFGPENSNVIMISTVFFALILFFAVWFLVVTPKLIQSGSIDKFSNNPTVLLITGAYALLGVIIFIGSYFSSLSIFKKQEL